MWMLDHMWFFSRLLPHSCTEAQNCIELPFTGTKMPSPVHKESSMKKLWVRLEVDELKRPAHSHNLNPTEHTGLNWCVLIACYSSSPVLLWFNGHFHDVVVMVRCLHTFSHLVLSFSIIAFFLSQTSGFKMHRVAEIL